MPLRCAPPSLLGSDRGRPLVRGQQGCEHLWGRPRPARLVPLGTRAGEGQSRQRGEASGRRRAAAEWTVSGTPVTKAGPGQLWVTGLLRGCRERERWQRPPQTEEQGPRGCHGETPTAWRDVGTGKAPGRVWRVLHRLPGTAGMSRAGSRASPFSTSVWTRWLTAASVR